MFGFGFFELLIVLLLGLIVLGPERLPVVARTLGRFYRRIRLYVTAVKQDISREMDLDAMMNIKSELEQDMQDFEARMQKMQADMAQHLQSSHHSSENTAGARTHTHDQEGDTQPSQAPISSISNNARVLTEEEQMAILLSQTSHSNNMSAGLGVSEEASK
ncbi:MAG: Sec-independent protein translocase protein TatB [Alcaligenaceae bacterium]|nr:Sec-independent protein translocase protein TatB [Alcaligenaceae bacterium]